MGSRGLHRVGAIVLLAAVVVSVVVFAQRQRSTTWPHYVSIEGFQFFEPDAFEEGTLKLLRESEAAAGRGDLTSALASMQRAVAHHHKQPTSNFELWDNLAELYCAKARTEVDTTRSATLRSKGLSLLREFRCGVDLWDGKSQCRDVVNRKGLCFRTLCDFDSSGYATGKWDAFMDAEPEPGTFTWHRKDAANLGAIGNVCN